MGSRGRHPARGRGQHHAAHAGAARRFDAKRRILERNAVGGQRIDALGRLQEHIGTGFSARDGGRVGVAFATGSPIRSVNGRCSGRVHRAPEKTFSDQFQMRYTVSTPARELMAVTVIREDCRAVPVEVSKPGGSTARIRIDNGGTLVADGLTVQLPSS